MSNPMDTKFLNDEKGNPTKVVIDYKDYVKIAKQMGLPLAPSNATEERTPYDWYTLTESANSILTGLIALASREQRIELGKPNPDQKRIADLAALGKDAMTQHNNNENFSSLDKMQAVIDKYSPVLLAEKKKLQF